MALKAQRRVRPGAEALEARALLARQTILTYPDGRQIPQDITRIILQRPNYLAGSRPQDRRKIIHEPDGTVAILTLYGRGTLKGTGQDPDGALNIVYNDTNSSTRIIARIHSHRGSGRIPLRSLRDADVPLASLSGIGSNQLDVVNLPDFDLVAGGEINVSGGLNVLHLGSIGPNTLIDVRSLPAPANSTFAVPTSPVPVLQFNTTSGGGVVLTGIGGLTVPGAQGTAGGQATSTTTTTTTGGTTGGGLVARVNPDGTVDLVPASTTAATTSNPPPGVSLLFDRIAGTPRANPLGDPQVFGYDPPSNSLVRFDARTGAALGTIPLPGSGATQAGVALGRYRGEQVVLAGLGTTVYAFDAATGRPVGSFSTGNLPISDLAYSDVQTVIVDARDQVVQGINLDRSLDAGRAVAFGAPFTPAREFTLSGGATGVPGFGNDFLTGAAHFDPFTPNQTQFGILTLNASNRALAELARTQVGSPRTLVNEVPPANPPFAFGAIDMNPALVTAFDPAGGTNTVTLYTTSSTTSGATGTSTVSFTPVGTVALAWPNRLTGLSESFHPELDGAAVINIEGITNRVIGREATGMVLNQVGFLGLVSIDRVTDSAIIGLPVGHVDIPQRENVTILSSADRPPGSRGVVTLVPGLRPVGPLASPRLGPAASGR